MATLSHKLSVLSDGEITVEPTDNRIMAKLLPDTQVPQWHYRCRSYDLGIPTKGVPQMVPFSPRVGTPLTREWQWFMMNLQIHSMTGMENFDQLEVDPKYNWKLLTREQRDDFTQWFNVFYDDHRFLTNDRGVNNCANFITGERTDQSLPMAWEVACAVNKVELLSRKRIMKYDTEWYEMKTLVGKNRPPSLREVNSIKTPELIHVAVTWMYNDNWGVFKTGDFPQVYNSFGYSKHSYYPLVSPEGKVLVETSRVSLLENGINFTSHFEI
jgi:hypothetical protein